MLSFFKIMKKITTRIPRKTLIFGLVLIVLSLVYWAYSRARFVIAYEEYAGLSASHSTYAFAPAVEANPVRNELNRLLSEILARPMSNAERLSLANQGLDMVRGMELQIDHIGSSGENSDAELNRAEWEGNRWGNMLVHSKVRELFLHAREESALIGDIRGLSYRANFHTEEILKRIVEDGGALTTAHVAELNRDLPQIEEQFNNRTNLYAKLQSEHAKTENVFNSIRGAGVFTRLYNRYFQKPVEAVQ